jgi:hypothetical protein
VVHGHGWPYARRTWSFATFVTSSPSPSWRA